MRARTSFVAVVFVLAAAAAAGLFWRGLPARDGVTPAGVSSPSPARDEAALARDAARFEAELTGRLGALCARSGGSTGVAVLHVESGRAAAVEGSKPLPLYSVFKLPLAVAVLKEVEENRLRLDQSVSVKPSELAPGWKGREDLWLKPSRPTVGELLELSVSLSDNTASEKLLQLVGGPEAVTRRMRALGFGGIDIRYTIRQYAARPDRPNTATASELARLLAALHKGELLEPPQRALLLGWMERATTGLRRLRADLPPGTVVADKTGTGDEGSTTNDVGLITLPEGKGHLAVAVLLTGSRLPEEAQEKLIAELARAAYDAYVSPAATQAPAPR